MKPTIVFLVPTISRFDLLERLLDSVDAQTRKPDRVIIIDNSNGIYKNDNYYVISASNLGVAESWNLGLKLAMDNELLLICNDDNKLCPNLIEKLEEEYLKNPEQVFYSFIDDKASAFSVFALNPKKAVEKIGLFDSSFYPAYYEDTDYLYRMKLNNIPSKIIYGTCFELGINNLPSQTLNGKYTSSELKDLINKGEYMNKQRYLHKWGGLPGKETYVIPYNIKL
jgi:GT2 family glycosyltransferase